MKRAAIIITLFLTVLLFGACDDPGSGGQKDSASEPTVDVDEYELAYITDGGSIDDHGVNQAVWQGLERYATDNQLTYTFYQPKNAEHDTFVDTIDKAIVQGAKVIVCLGPALDSAVYQAQSIYPSIQFILFDGEPHSADYQTYSIEDNVYAAYFAEEELAFLAGYSVVKDGYTQLGYIGGLAIEANIDSGYGFIAGAKYAALEDNISGINIDYHYAGAVQNGEDVKTIASLWYNAGTEIIFTSGGKVQDNLVELADPNGFLVIGCDTDQSYQSQVVVTSAIKKYSSVVYNSLSLYYNNNLSSGEIDELGTVEDGVALTMDTSKFEIFSEQAYEEIYIKMVLGEITVPNHDDADNAQKLANNKVKVVITD